MAERKKQSKRKPAAKRSSKKKAPAKRGRRGHLAVDQQEGLRDYIDAMLLETPRPTYDEMIDRLKGTGFHIARSTLARYGFEFEFKRQEIRQLVEKAMMLRSKDPEEVLALEEAVTHVLETRMLEAQLQTDKPLTKEELELAYAHAKLQSSSAQRERTKLAVTRGITQALKILRAELTEILKDDPALLRKVLTKVEDVRDRQLEKGGLR